MPLYLATAHGKHYPLTQISDTAPINNIIMYSWSTPDKEGSARAVILRQNLKVWASNLTSK